VASWWQDFQAYSVVKTSSDSRAIVEYEMIHIFSLLLGFGGRSEEIQSSCDELYCEL